MNEKLLQLQETRAGTFFSSFSPSSRAALFFALPFTIVDAVHYFTAGTAMVVSFPVVILFYLSCGVLAGKLAYEELADYSGLARVGAGSGVKLWALSTLVNTIISIVIGASSLGTTLLLGIPYLCICGPVIAIGGAVVGAFGAYAYGFFHGRSTQPVVE